MESGVVVFAPIPFRCLPRCQLNFHEFHWNGWNAQVLVHWMFQWWYWKKENAGSDSRPQQGYGVSNMVFFYINISSSAS
jgi:hypothetical protein